MDLQTKKLDLINWLISLNDNTIINKIYALKKKNRQDWYDELSDADKKEIERGLEDLENGNSISHEKVMFSVKQKIEQLKKSS